jgi:hypothetical protein
MYNVKSITQQARVTRKSTPRDCFVLEREVSGKPGIDNITSITGKLLMPSKLLDQAVARV